MFIQFLETDDGHVRTLQMAHVDVHHLCDGIYALVFQESCELGRCKSCAETNVLPSNWVHAHESTLCFILQMIKNVYIVFACCVSIVFPCRHEMNSTEDSWDIM